MYLVSSRWLKEYLQRIFWARPLHSSLVFIACLPDNSLLTSGKREVLDGQPMDLFLPSQSHQDMLHVCQEQNNNKMNPTEYIILKFFYKPVGTMQWLSAEMKLTEMPVGMSLFSSNFLARRFPMFRWSTELLSVLDVSADSFSSLHVTEKQTARHQSYRYPEVMVRHFFLVTALCVCKVTANLWQVTANLWQEDCFLFPALHYLRES